MFVRDSEGELKFMPRPEFEDVLKEVERVTVLPGLVFYISESGDAYQL